MNPFLLELQDLPAWYTLAFETRPALAIAFRTHPAVFDAIVRDLSTEDYDIGQYRKMFGFKPFVVPSENRWGFPTMPGAAVAEPPERGEDGWTTWRFHLPRIGLGGREQPDWHTANAVCATLAVFIVALDRSVHDVEGAALGDARQLMLISCSIRPPTIGYDAPISAILSPEALRRLPPVTTPVTLPDIGRVMHLACEHVWGETLDGELYARGFEAYLDLPDRLHLRMPMGNAVGLDPEGWERRPGYGSRLVCHNTDTAIHQLTLLAGLARLHELLARPY